MTPKPRRRTVARVRGSEADFQAQVEQLAKFYGWRVYHAPDNRPVTSRSGKRYVQNVEAGFPDLVLVRGRELIFAELKTDTGRVRAEQHDWLRDLGCVAEASGGAVEVALWRPADFDELHARLSRGRHRVEPLYRDAAGARTLPQTTIDDHLEASA